MLQKKKIYNITGIEYCTVSARTTGETKIISCQLLRQRDAQMRFLDFSYNKI